ncbi:hypothetical protein [Rhodococcoides fascians]|uniref:hypothetical protein n=1 Tax=Rhodococcoides fascians TaxID=1828 RepID=UPI000A439F12|nr:hypothetical protein [Rhodococcus fascians]
MRCTASHPDSTSTRTRSTSTDRYHPRWRSPTPHDRSASPRAEPIFARSNRDLTLRRFIVLGGGGHRRVFGTPESITDDLIGWTERGAADGFTVFVESLPQFADHIVPLLWGRGVHRREYSGTTLRDNLAQHSG